MFKPLTLPKVLLVAILLTFAAIGAHHLMPPKVLTLSPGSVSEDRYFLLNMQPQASKPASYWIDKSKGHFHCPLDANAHTPSCVYVYLLSPDDPHGVDLQQYRQLHLDIRYKGSADHLRIAIRNYDPRISKAGDDNSNKFNFVLLRATELTGPADIQLSEFKVADWWVAQFKLSRQLSQPDLRHALTLAIDVEGDLRSTEHDIEIRKIEFVGERVSSEQWYLGILLSWMACATLYIVLRIVFLQRRERQQNLKISSLSDANLKLRLESDKFRKLSTVDALTNAFNRHGIEQIIESLDLRRGAASIIVFDLDHFKRINDEHGHDVGDLVLQKVCEAVLRGTRSGDKLGRWGGEEFILVCPGTEADMAQALAEKLRTLILNTRFQAGQPWSTSASFGVTQIAPDEPFRDAFRRADEALYRAKSLGRNRVERG